MLTVRTRVLEGNARQCRAFAANLPLRHGRQPRRLRVQSGVLESLSCSPYRDAAAVGVALAGSITLVKTFDGLAARGLIDQKLSRKLIHILAGPGFMLTWPLFRLLLVGSGAWKQENMVKAVSRSGDRTELLRGPLIYVCVLCAVTVLSWRSNAAGMFVIAMMCGGDGVADIVGRRFGTAKLPWNAGKSYAGSLAMLLGGALLGLGLITYFNAFHFIAEPAWTQLPALLAISAVCTLVESLPITSVIDDNVSVPLAAGLMGYMLLPWFRTMLLVV